MQIGQRERDPGTFVESRSVGRPQRALRTLRPRGEARVEELLAGCSRQSIRDRFFGHVADPLPMLREQVREGIWEGCAVGAFAGTAPDAALVAVVIGLPDRQEMVWEISLLVGDEWQGRGIGTALLRGALREAARAGVTPIACVERSNQRALRLVHHAQKTGAAFEVAVG